jgi:hypothetical protein
MTGAQFAESAAGRRLRRVGVWVRMPAWHALALGKVRVGSACRLRAFLIGLCQSSGLSPAGITDFDFVEISGEIKNG